MTADDLLTTGQYRYRFYRSPHLPHGWDAGVLFEETQQTLFCSDLFHHFGNVEPLTNSDLIEPARQAMQQMQQGPLAGYLPYTRQTESVLRSLAGLNPQTLAVMHGSSYRGQTTQLLTNLASVIKENFDQP
jgi:flavorubredoxin